MHISDFDYYLPKELIAQYPVKEREKCRLMVLDRAKGSVQHKTFEDIVGYFKAGDCLVLNDTKVMPARIFGKRKTGGKVELFLLEACRTENPVCEALVRPSARLKDGERIALESGGDAEVLGRGEVGRFVRFERPVEEILKAGHVPLPPYIGREDEPSDRIDYQTVYADKEGATASPTAGLHFTRDLLSRIALREVRCAYVTLHTNYGTFAPVKEEEVERHKMHKEYFEMPQGTAEAVKETKERGGRVFAVGTTATRVLEHCFIRRTPYSVRCTSGYTDLYIYPGYRFQVVDHLITNFHLPKSTLMLLVSAFAGREFVLEAYRKAVEEKYRFFSYGDAMLIL
jgi:S-adenosylmethionine:tRNA ribosyltransferase-isomerase